MTEQKTSLVEICIFGNNNEVMALRVFPNICIACCFQSHISNMLTVRIYISEGTYQTMREILVKQQLHAPTRNNLRSRSAANARHALMSSRVRSGKSVRISSSDMPDAR